MLDSLFYESSDISYIFVVPTGLLIRIVRFIKYIL
jgi:hypothetical protein